LKPAILLCISLYDKQLIHSGSWKFKNKLITTGIVPVSVVGGWSIHIERRETEWQKNILRSDKTW